jgi:chromosome partitioning protein
MIAISIAIQKGGSGKTTTAVNLAAAFKRAGKRVLVIDADPQSNLTNALGIVDEPEPNIYHLLRLSPRLRVWMCCLRRWSWRRRKWSL